jgi:integrase
MVVLDGRAIYLGRFGTPESRTRYAQAISEWSARGGMPRADDDITIVEIIARYWQFARGYYTRGGKPTEEIATINAALAPLKELYGHEPARSFSPLKIQAVRHKMLERNWARSTINDQVSRIKRMIKWAVAQELIPPAVHHGLQAVTGLRRFRSEARETEPVKPVPEALIDAVRPLVSSAIEAMIDLQLLTGMRPGEVCAMRGCDLDTSGNIWTYVPAQHKTQHHGRGRTVFLGPKAQAIVENWLKSDLQAFLFSPAESEQRRQIERHNARVTPQSCGNRPGTHRVRRPKRKPGMRYSTASYRRAIARACESAYPPPSGLDPTAVSTWRRGHSWYPHQLRHNAATRLRKEFGLEAARVILGHATMRMTELYAEIDHAKAASIVARVG